MLRDEVIICSINLSVPGTLVGFERQIARLILFIRSSATMVESKTSTKSKQTLSSILVGKTYEHVMTRFIHKEKKWNQDVGDQSIEQSYNGSTHLFHNCVNNEMTAKSYPGRGGRRTDRSVNLLG